eukprot:775648-Prorocentrum_minimum.AAC.1
MRFMVDPPPSVQDTIVKLESLSLLSELGSVVTGKSASLLRLPFDAACIWRAGASERLSEAGANRVRRGGLCRQPEPIARVEG